METIEYFKSQDGSLMARIEKPVAPDISSIQAEITRLQGRKQAKIDERDAEIADITAKYKVYIDDFQAQITAKESLLVKAQELAVVADANVVAEEM